MKIKKILIEVSVEEKISKKHGVHRNEIEEGLFEGKPIFFKTKDEKYMAFLLRGRYISVVFTFTQSVAKVITAYPSSEWQIRLYKRKRSQK